MNHPLTNCMSEIEMLQGRICEKNARIEVLEAALRASHQNCLALWEALEGGASPRCRDCADFNGRCQGNGLACDPQKRALERIKNLRSALAPEQGP